MKKAKLKLFLLAFMLLSGICSNMRVNAQQKLIYYWHFDKFTGLSGAISPVTNPIQPVHANWSSLDSTKALISYVPAYSTLSKKYTTYWDAGNGEASDTFNVRAGGLSGTTSNYLRVRNPSDSMELLFAMPTTNYKNLTLSFGLEKSSLTSGMGKQVFDYSTDGGSSWKTSGLSILSDSLTNAVFNLMSVSFKGDAAVNNNSNFIFRIKFLTLNTGTKGNNRFDNISLEGDTIIPQAISISNTSSTYSQNFDSLSNSTASSVMPYGWYLYETGTNANSTYAVDSGSLTSGNTYSYGHKGNTNRALGSLASGSLLPNYGVAIRNNTGKTLTSLSIAFTVEQWRLGSGTRGNPDSMYASMSMNATGLNSGTWTSAPSLSFTSPVYTGSAGQLDGNNSANQKKVNATLTGLSVPAGGLLWLKWTDPNIVSSDDALAIDDFSIAANDPKTVLAPLYKIRDIRTQDANGVADSVNKGKGFIKGVVVSPTYNTSYLQFSLVDSTGAITIFTSTVKNYTPAVGDSIEVRGHVTQFNGVTEYTSDSIIVLTKGTAIETPSVLITLDEAHESHLIKIKNVHIIDPTQWTGSGTGFNVSITDGKDTFSMRITSAINLFLQSAIKGNFNVTGVETQFKSSTPFIGGYQIEPRGISDIELLVSAALVPLYKISDVRPQDANGVADSVNKAKGYLKGVVVSPSYSKTYLQFSLVDNTGAITVFTSTVKYYTPAVGDSIMVHGYITQFNGVTEYTTDTIINLTKGTAIETPAVLTTLDEPHESHLIKIAKVHIIDPTQWTGSGPGFNVNITDGKDTFLMRITNAIDLFSQSAIKGNFNVTGIETQFKSTTPFIGGYEIEPRSSNDIELITAPSLLPLYAISQVRQQDANGVADSLNKAKGYIKGVVVSPSYSTSYLQFSLVDNTGAITIFTSSIKYYTPAVGDSIMAQGYVTQYNGVTEYTTDSIIVLTKGTSIETPSVLATLDEAHESHLIRINKVHLVDPTQWTGAGTGFNVNITNGPDTFVMRITSAIDIFKKAPIKGLFNVTGVETQFKSASPYIGSYQIEPRGVFDIQPIPLKLYKIAQVTPYNATTGIADSITLVCMLKGVVQSPSLTGSSIVEGFAVQDNTGGISVEGAAHLDGYNPNVGDSVFLRGTVLQSNGLTIFVVDSIKKLNGGSSISPLNVTVLDETTESKLVKMSTFKLTTPSQWDTTKAVNGLFNVQATQYGTSGVINIIIAKGTNLYANNAVPTGYFDVTGIGSQQDPTVPFLSDYVLIPRSIADFAHSSGIEQAIDNNADISIFPNPASDYVNVSSSVKMSRITMIDMIGHIVYTEIPESNLSKINTGSLNKGIYILKIENGTSTYLTRFEKE